MKREFLTDLGLESEQVDKIMAEHGKTVNSLKEELDSKKNEVKELSEQLKRRDKQLDELSNQAKGNEELQQQIEQLKEQNKQTAKEYQEKLEKQAFDFALEKALTNAQAKNPKAVRALLDTEAIKLDGDKLLGLEEQLNALKESDGYLFGEEPKLKGRTPNTDGTPVDNSGPNPWAKDTFNLTEQGKLLRGDPEKAKQLIQQAGGNPAQYGL